MQDLSYRLLLPTRNDDIKHINSSCLLPYLLLVLVCFRATAVKLDMAVMER